MLILNLIVLLIYLKTSNYFSNISIIVTFYQVVLEIYLLNSGLFINKLKKKMNFYLDRCKLQFN
jgi:hypothetical protein